MASSSSAGEKVGGTMILVNMYLAKTDAEIGLEDVHHEDPIQAYIVHNDKIELGTESKHWNYSSNTVGLALARCEMDYGRASLFPTSLRDAMVMFFVPNVTIPATLTQNTLKCLSECDAPYEEQFYIGVQTALRSYYNAGLGNRAEQRHVGNCLEKINERIQRQRTQSLEAGQEPSYEHNAYLTWVDVDHWVVEEWDQQSRFYTDAHANALMQCKIKNQG